MRCGFCGSYEARCYEMGEARMCERMGTPQPDPLAPEMRALVTRINDEADLCRMETATDIAALLDDASAAILALGIENFKLRRER